MPVKISHKTLEKRLDETILSVIAKVDPRNTLNPIRKEEKLSVNSKDIETYLVSQGYEVKVFLKNSIVSNTSERRSQGEWIVVVDKAIKSQKVEETGISQPSLSLNESSSGKKRKSQFSDGSDG